MVDTDDTRRTIHDGRRTTPRVWHKLPTGELKNLCLCHTGAINGRREIVTKFAVRWVCQTAGKNLGELLKKMN